MARWAFILMAYDWLCGALDETYESMVTLLAHRDERVFDALTPCPGWTVRDIVSHVIGVQLQLNGSPLPELTSDAPHIRNEQGRRNESWVAARRHLSGAEVLGELSEVTSSASLARRQWTDIQWGDPCPTYGGLPRWRVAEIQVVDAWIHLQDIRDALLEPSDDHGAGEEIVLNSCEAVAAFSWARHSGATEGHVLRLNIAGRLARSVTIAIINGRGEVVASHDGPPDAEISTATALFWRACAGRISADAFARASATNILGNRELAMRWLDGIHVIQ